MDVGSKRTLKKVLNIADFLWDNIVFMQKNCTFKESVGKVYILTINEEFLCFWRKNSLFMQKEKKNVHLKNISPVQNSYFEN